MKPYQILLFTVAILFILLGLVYIFPADGIKIGEEGKLTFVTPKELFEQKKVNYEDIDEILKDTAMEAANLPVIYNSQVENNFNDSLKYKPPQIGGLVETVSVQIGDLMQVSHPILYPSGNKQVLYSFFDAIKSNKELVRIIHYGDSQIEGDRVTDFIRNQLQLQFGGTGIGMISTKQAYNYDRSIKHRHSPNWRRYTLKEHARYIKGRRFGAQLSFTRFAPLTYMDESVFTEPDSLLVDTVFETRHGAEVEQDAEELKKITNPESGYIYKAWLRFTAKQKTYETNRRYSYCSVYYAFNKKPVSIEVFADKQLVAKKMLSPTNTLSRVVFEVNSPEQLEMRFAGPDSPNFYGISFDGRNGIAVDNVPMRGSAGTIFTSANFEFLKRMYEMMNVKLLILQFGGNVTPYITSNYDYYQKMFSSQLEAFRKILPNASIIVIGPADMSRNAGGQFVSYPNIPDIRDALQRAAFNNGAAFWDMYEAMGGKNSMPSWVYANPPLATKDFTHFTHLGAEVIGRMFYNALISEYNQYMSNGKYQ